MSCCHGAPKYMEINQDTQIKLIKPFKSLTLESDLTDLTVANKQFLVYLGYAEVIHNSKKVVKKNESNKQKQLDITTGQ